MNISDEALEVIKRIEHTDRVIIYGAKEKGKNMLSVCRNIGWSGQIQVVVTNLEKEIRLLGEDAEVKEARTVIIDKDTLIFVCMQENFYEEVNQVLLGMGVDMGNVLYPSSKLILELKKYAIFYQLKMKELDLDLLKGFSPDDLRLLFFTWDAAENWHCRSINEKMWDIAVQETAEYVLQNMRKVTYYKNREEYQEMLAARYMKGNGLKLEFGVAGGTSLWRFTKYAKDKIYGFDSFEGLPEKYTADIGIGFFKQKKIPNVPENVELIVGYFSDTLPNFLTREDVANRDIEFIHIDCDLYSSTKQVFQFLESKIQRGTVMAFDEYFNFPGWKNEEFLAFQEWVQEKCVEYEYIAYVENCTQAAVKILNIAGR